MGLFNKKPMTAEQAALEAQRKTPQGKYAAARSNLLLVVVFSLINLVLTVVEADMYFLFSSTFPQVALVFGQAFTEELQMPVFFVVGLVLAIVSVGLYALCWLLSKKNIGWMIAATVLFGLDCLLLLLFLDVEMIVDIVFHVWVMVCLISGCIAGSKGGAEPAPVPPAEPQAEYTPDGQVPQPPVMMVNGEPVAMEPAREEEE